MREALRRMEAVGLVRHYGRARGWRLRKGARVELLRLLIELERKDMG